MVSNLIEYILKSVIHKEINNVFLFCKITKVLKKNNLKNNLLLSSWHYLSYSAYWNLAKVFAICN